MQISLKGTQELDNFNNPIGASFTAVILDEKTGANFEHPYTLTPEELKLDLDVIKKRELEKALAEFNKFAYPKQIIPINETYTTVDNISVTKQ